MGDKKTEDRIRWSATQKIGFAVANPGAKAIMPLSEEQAKHLEATARQAGKTVEQYIEDYNNEVAEDLPEDE